MGIVYDIDRSFFKKWSPQMAYVLGYIYADGSLDDSSYMRAKYFTITSIDLMTIENIKFCLKSKHTIRIQHPPNRQTSYIFRVGSHEMFDDLIALGLYPNKSLTIGFPYVPIKYLPDFVRGNFDGDGCIYLWRTKGVSQRLIIRKLSAIFSSGSRIFLEGLIESLSVAMELKQRKIYKSQRCFQLRMGTADTVRLYNYMYYNNLDKHLYLRRKYAIFQQYFKLKNGQVVKR